MFYQNLTFVTVTHVYTKASPATTHHVLGVRISK